tara:strand:- start:739 stop:1155 length:417 start_codon:yes stop_codon:yes gene_type:complete
MIRLLNKIPEFCLSHWLLRIPLAVIFLQQGMSKLPYDIEDGAAFDLSPLVWWFVTYGELGAGLGIIVSGLLAFKFFGDTIRSISDLFTRFCGIVMCSIMTGVIWIGEPDSLMDVILYDNLHVFLWVGGLYFALRGSRT